MEVSVSIVKCQTYDEKEVQNALRRSIDLVGGIGNFVKKGNRVLLKPNLLYGKSPEKAVTTHPSILRGMIQIVLEADVVINLPKFKTHSMMLLTLGVKNLFGCIPGPRKALWHLKAGEDRKTFAQILVDVYQVVQPSLTLLDGVVGMGGDGPNRGRPMQMGLVL